MTCRRHAAGRPQSILVCSTGTSSNVAGISHRLKFPICSRKNYGAVFEPCVMRNRQSGMLASLHVRSGVGKRTSVSTPARANSRLVSWLEKLNRVAIRILQQDLLAARSDFHLIAKMQSRRFQNLDPSGQVGDLENDTVPPARLLAMSVGHRTRTRCARATENQLEMAARNLSEGGQILELELEAELLCIEVRRATDILDLISDTPQASHEALCRTGGYG